MQTNYCYAPRASHMENMQQYRRLLAQAREPMQKAAGLPPRQRRAHRAPLGLHVSDLLNLTMAVTTILATGVVLMGM